MIMCNGGVGQVQVSYTYKQHNVHVGLLNLLSLDVFFRSQKRSKCVGSRDCAPDPAGGAIRRSQTFDWTRERGEEGERTRVRKAGEVEEKEIEKG